MGTIRPLLLMVSLAELSCHPSPRTQPTCHTPDDVSAQYVGVVRVTLGNENDRRLWRLPEVAAKDVKPVTDSSVCAQAAKAMVRMWGEKKSESGALYVIRLGSAYAVIDRETGVDADGIYYFASDWTPLSQAFAQ